MFVEIALEALMSVGWQLPIAVSQRIRTYPQAHEWLKFCWSPNKAASTAHEADYLEMYAANMVIQSKMNISGKNAWKISIINKYTGIFYNQSSTA